MKVVALSIFILAMGLMSLSLSARDQPSPTTAEPLGWSSKAAAAYLDQRMVWWMGWAVAARDHGTFCVSCHTAVPYALARPALRLALGEENPVAPERQLLEDVTKRVRMWKDVAPVYSKDSAKVAESRGTESILNAVILMSHESSAHELSPDARLALENMWGEQLKSGDDRGAWTWLQFHNSPWEGDSQYYGAALAGIALGATPADYRSSPEIQDNMKLLREYLARKRDSQILMDRVMLLEASTKLPRLLTRRQQKAIIKEALSKQQPDGGFSLSAFVGGWKRHDGTPLETKSDGYATGVVALTLRQAGMKADRPEIKRALAWLVLNQDKTEGRWLAYSLNKQRDLQSDVGRFMSDAATAYAVLALEQSQ